MTGMKRKTAVPRRVNPLHDLDEEENSEFQESESSS